MSKLVHSDLYRALVLTLLAGIATVTVAFANRDVYTKEQIDDKLDAREQVEDVRHNSIDKEVGLMHDDIKWLVRKLGGEPSADSSAEVDRDTP